MRVSGWKITKREQGGEWGFWLNQPHRILTEDRPGGQTSPGEQWGMKNPMRP